MLQCNNDHTIVSPVYIGMGYWYNYFEVSVPKICCNQTIYLKDVCDKVVFILVSNMLMLCEALQMLFYCWCDLHHWYYFTDYIEHHRCYFTGDFNCLAINIDMKCTAFQ